MKKSEVCVKLTRKNCKKVLEILEMFGEPVYNGDKDRWSRGVFYSGYKYATIDKFGDWTGFTKHQLTNWSPDRKVVKPRELRNILFREQLKKGDIVALKYVGEDELWITKIESISKKEVVLGGGMTPGDGYRDFSTTTETLSELNFLRFATDEEKALLEPKATIVTYTREVWVNHFHNGEYLTYRSEENAKSLERDSCITVKATLTYDIPMTKV